MINIKARHLAIIKAILKKYDYTFYLFGSRLTKQIKEFSDVDLVHWEYISHTDLASIEEEFEESDLPYKVDLVSYHKCSKDFGQIIKNNYTCIYPSKMLLRAEQALLGHFRFVPATLSKSVYTLDNVSITNCQLNSSMFNIAFGRPNCNQNHYREKISNIINNFNKQPLAFWVPSSLHCEEFNRQILNAGLKKESDEYLMICNLEEFKQPSSNSQLKIVPVLEKDRIKDFISIIANAYDNAAKSFYEKFESNDLKKQEKFFIGYHKDRPVSVCNLFVHGQLCCIFNLITDIDNRCKGFGSCMIGHLLQFAKNSCIKYAALLASGEHNMQFYKRFGFKYIGQFDCFEYQAK